MLTREFENERFFEGFKIIECESSLLAVAKKEIVLPSEKKIILFDQLSEKEKTDFNLFANNSCIFT